MNRQINRWRLVRYALAVTLAFSYLFIRAQDALQVAQVSITVSDLNKIVPFFEETLTFKKVSEYELEGDGLQQLFGIPDSTLRLKAVQMQLGGESIELLEFESGREGRPVPEDSRSNDLWFQHIAVVVSDMEAAYRRLREHKVQYVSTAPQLLPDYLPAAAGISAFYFRDPDGHNLEIINFPPGKGQARWQQAAGGLFLGIDHTAIGIDETDLQLKFYQDLLGLAVGGNSENYGVEQEHLNQVFGAHLLITGLHARKGFGVEFLDYLAPPGGRKYPAGSRPTDLWHWHTSIRVSDIDQVYRRLQEAGCLFISNGVTDVCIPTLNATRAFLVRDFDGHAILLFE
jgi:catechol 2,3-dioxygenase-like lactoylglutathione lyase family enzyme